MLFYDTLINLNPFVERAVDSLFDLAFSNQSHEQDLLLILEHGFYHPLLLNSSFGNSGKLSPYTIGPGYLGLAENTQYQFYDNYRRQIIDDRNGFLEAVKSDEKERLKEELSIHLELFLYLKFWESDRVVKMFYMLSQLVQGKPFDWHFVIEKHEGKGANKNRKGIPFILTYEVRVLLYDSCPLFSFLIECIYNEGLRNAAAHSQYSFQGRYLHTYRYDKKSKDYVAKVYSFDEWEVYSHMTVILYNVLLKNINKYNEVYIQRAKSKHYGLPLRITKEDGSQTTEFYAYNGFRWNWYKNTEQARGEWDYRNH